MYSFPSEGFEALVNPISPDKFISDIFEKQSHFFLSEVPKVDFKIERFENLLWAFEETLDKRVQLNYKGNNIELHRKASGKDWFRTCLDRYHEGATIIFNGIDEIDPDVARFARSIDRVFKGKTSVNAFLTPPGSHGFLPHFDTHDVFILQSEGEKHWELFKHEIELPVDKQMYLIDQEKVGEPQADYHLRQNNVLYIPRGLVHSSHTSDTFSLHLTVGIRPRLVTDLHQAYLEIMAEEKPSFRKSKIETDKSSASLFGSGDEKVKSASLNKLISNKLNIKLASSIKPIPGFHLKGIHNYEEISAKTKVEKATETFALVGEKDRVNLYYPGAGLTAEENIIPGYFSLPAAAEEAIQFILDSNGPFCPDDLPPIFPEETRVMIVRRLVVEGFLKLM